MSLGIIFCYCCSAQVVAGIRYMMHTREQLFKQLEVAEVMHAFIFHHPSGIKEMCSWLEMVEADLATAQKAVADGAEKLKMAEEEKRVIQAEADQLKGEKEALEGQVNGVEQENSQLKKKVDKLRVSLAAQKKETEGLQAGLVAQRKEMEARFAAQKKELEIEYQRQVDEIYFFGYHCCMKKNDIMHDIPFLPSDDEDAILVGPPQ